MSLVPVPPSMRFAAAVVLALGTAGVHAALIDEVGAASRQADGELVRLRVDRALQVRQQSPLAESDVYRVRLDLGLGAEPIDKSAPPEFRRVAASGQAPEFTLSFAAGATPNTLELTIQMSGRRGLTVRQGPSPREIDLVFAPLVEAAPAPAAQAPEPTPDDAALQQVEQKAADLMQQARAALEAKRPDDAVKLLNELLLLPPNRQSEAAQALVGDAWIGAGNSRRARLEYELYLKLYPKGLDAQRVGQALVAAGGAVPKTPAGGQGATQATAAAPAAPATTFAGNIAQYFSSGATKARSLVNLPSGIDQTTITHTSERALITSADLSGRWSSAENELRAVVRGSGTKSFGSNARSSSLVSAAYADWRHLPSQLAVRLGRQSAISGGLLGSFDGVSLAYPLRQGIKLDVMGGVPANQLVDSPSQRLLGAMLEIDGLSSGWGGNTYFVDQTSEGYTNRRAVGGEVRYANDAWSGYALVDYDVEFRAVNAVTLQGSWLAPGQTTVTVLVDERKAPSLALNNAMILSGGSSLDALVKKQGLTQVRADALATSATARQAMISVSRPLNPQWQLSGDLRYSAIGALPQVGDLFEATPATGAQYTMSMQATGSNLFSQRDIHSFSLAVMSTPQFHGVQFGYSNLTGLADTDITLEPSLRYSTQTDSTGLRQQRYSIGLRSSWRVNQRGSVLAEGLAEHAPMSGPTSSGSTNATSFYVGYRYELF